MRKVWLALVVLTFLDLPGLAENPAGLAEAWFAALAERDGIVLQEAYASDALVFFYGTPRTGFLTGTEIAAGWEEVLGALLAVQVTPRKLEVLPEVRPVIALFALGEDLEAIWAMRFDPSGKIVREEFLLYGVSPLDQPPVLDAQVVLGEYTQTVSNAGVTFSFRNGALPLFGALSAPGTGWVSVGFDPEFSMRGANFVFAWADQAGVHVQDHYGNVPTSHRQDKTTHVFLAAGIEEGGVTTVEFIIPLDSGDLEDKPLVRGKTYTVLLAYHRNSGTPSRHTARGQAQITLE